MVFIEPPRLIKTITLADLPDHVPTLISMFKDKRINLKMLSDAFNQKITWAYRGIDYDKEEWVADNSWATVWAAMDKKFSYPDYLFLSEQYDMYVEEQEKIKCQTPTI